jgi:hypothetical protein
VLLGVGSSENTRFEGASERNSRPSRIYDKGSNGFDRFSGLLGTGVKQASANRPSFSLLLTTKNRDAEIRPPILTRVPDNPLDPPNPVEPFVMDA